MKKYILSLSFILSFLYSIGQVDSIKKVMIVGAENCIKKIIGPKLFNKHFILDTLSSNTFPTNVYAGDFHKDAGLGREKCFAAVYMIVQSSDTLGWVSLYIDHNGKPLNDWRDPSSSGKPEVILGYKKLLTNKFKIGFHKAIDLGKQKGFLSTPFLNAETDFGFTTVNGNSFIKVKYFWSFIELDYEKGKNGILNINAETGEVETEKYYPRMNYK